MPNQVLILHGWSDTSKSFHDLAKFLKQSGYQTVPLWLGDYISLDDDVSVADVAKRMEIVIEKLLASGTLGAPFDMIVHSTGGLVAREWIARHADSPARCKLRRLIMLAPANFGSPLAHLGQSMLGRVVKGWKNWFSTGKRMLECLELGSPYQWDLACRDLLVRPGNAEAWNPYRADGVWPFVIIGSHPYTNPVAKVVNENGTDGTVRVAGANMNVYGFTANFATSDEKPVITPWKPRLDTLIPLAVLPDRTHGSIVTPAEVDKGIRYQGADQLGGLIIEALSCPDWAGYQDIAVRWEKINEATAGLGSNSQGQFAGSASRAELFHQYYQVNVRVRDDHGEAVDDFFVEFAGHDLKRDANDFSVFHKDVLEDVHPYSRNGSYRSFYIDRNDLFDKFYGQKSKTPPTEVNMLISAAPRGNNVSFFASDNNKGAGVLTVHWKEGTSWLRRNSTHFVDVISPRVASEKVFSLKKH